MINSIFSRSTSATLAMAVLLLCSAQAGAEDARAAQGERDYRSLCASCHGVEGHGDGPVAPALDPRPTDLTEIAKRRDGTFPVPAISRVIDGRDPILAHGKRDMPVWGVHFKEGTSERAFGYSRGRIQLLVEYLKSIQDPPLE